MLFDRTAEGLTAGVYYAGLRHKIIANNIANVDTPNYKALDISFRQQLEDFMKERKTSSGAVSLLPPTLMFTSDPNNPKPRIDRNTVSIDRELIKLSQNSILHNTYLQLLNSKFRILKSAISGNA